MTESNRLSNTLTFKEGLERMNKVAQQVGLQVGKEVITSRDEKVKKAQALLNIKNVLPEFVKWQLPVYLDRPSQLFITVAPPKAKVPTHSHNEGAGIRFIASGSIFYKGTELTTGDWMYIPEGAKYEFETGPVGACMCYCYCCCCVPSQQ